MILRVRLAFVWLTIIATLAAPPTAALAEDKAQGTANAGDHSVAIVAQGNVELTINDIATIKKGIQPLIRNELERHAPSQQLQLQLLQGLLDDLKGGINDSNRTTQATMQALQAQLEQWTAILRDVETHLDGEERKRAEVLLREGNLTATRNVLAAQNAGVVGTWVFVPSAIATGVGVGAAVLFWMLGESAADNLQRTCPPGACTSIETKRAVDDSRIRTYDTATNIALVGAAVGLAGMIVGGLIWSRSVRADESPSGNPAFTRAFPRPYLARYELGVTGDF